MAAFLATAVSSSVCQEGAWPPAQFAVNTACQTAGIDDLAPYRNMVAVDQGESFMPVLSSHDLSQVDDDVTQAVIWLHGLLGDANNYFCDGLAAARSAGAERSTLTLAPWFGSERLSAAAWNGTADDNSSSLCWDGAHWISGGDDFQEESSAFAALDLVLGTLQQFPRLQRVSVAGFSAGCQLASRWSFFSRITDSLDLNISFILGDCGSYLFLDDSRPADECTPLRDTGAEHECHSFAAPNTTQQEDCADFNGFKYGLNFSKNDLAGNSYISLFGEESLEAAKTNFAKRDVRLLLGAMDACQCQVPGFSNPSFCFPSGVSCGPSLAGDGCCDTYPDSLASGEMPLPNVVDFRCQAMLQGSNRLQRGLNWASHLKDFYTRRGVNYTMPVAIFEGLHDGTAWGHSEQFAQWAGWNDDSSIVV
jgi:hypothetical protein